MNRDELGLKRFELEQKIKLEELDLKKKAFDLKIQEKKSQTIFTPLVLSIVGGLVTLITGIVLKYFESRSTIDLEDKKFQSTLLLKAVEAKNYDEFSDMLMGFRENGLLAIDSQKIADLKKKRFIQEQLSDSIKLALKNPPRINSEEGSHYMIVAASSTNLDDARKAKAGLNNKNLGYVEIWQKNNNYETCVGHYGSYPAALDYLFALHESGNTTAYIARFDQWCSDPTYDAATQIYVCK